MTKPSAFGAIALAVFSGIVAALNPAHGQQSGPARASVIELFTSQGCSSCPPADRILRQLSEHPGIIALSFPVSYWDYLGWRDTLARPENAERQRAYAQLQGDGQVFTPQVVINGLKTCVGSDLHAIEAALKSTAAAITVSSVPLAVRHESGKLVIEAGAAPPKSRHRNGKVWVAAVRHSLPVAIGSGENAGSTVTYTNVVRRLVDIGDWEGASASYALPLSSLPKDEDMVVVLLQAEKVGPILAAAKIKG